MRLAMKKRGRNAMAYATARGAKALLSRKPLSQQAAWTVPKEARVRRLIEGLLDRSDNCPTVARAERKP
jgi:hypothetical protein